MGERTQALVTLDRQAEILEWVRSRQGQAFMHHYSLDVVVKGQLRMHASDDTVRAAALEQSSDVLKERIRWDENFPQLAEQFERNRKQLELQLQFAETYHVTDEMCELITFAAQSMPDTKFEREEVPDPVGFVWLETPIINRDRHNREVLIRAISWMEGEVPYYEYDAGIDALSSEVYFQEGIALTFYGDATHPKDNCHDLWVQEGHDSTRVFPYSVLHTQGLAYGSRINAEELPEYEGIPALEYHWMRAFWRLSQEKITDVRMVSPDRPTRRRSERSGMPPAPIRVVELRRHSDRQPVEPGPGREWTHRWIVRGHWRRLHTGRLTWVSTYVKGPEDKPFISKDKVFDLRR